MRNRSMFRHVTLYAIIFLCLSIAAAPLVPGDELAETVATLLEQLGENPEREEGRRPPKRQFN